MARRALGWSLVLLSLLLVGCDHATKLAAEATLSRGRAVQVVPGVVDLTYAQNHDTAFSLTRAIASPLKAGALSVAATVGLIAILAMWWTRRAQASRMELVGYSLAAAGGLGNAIDRYARGYVVDFIHLHHWPVFNVADIAVVAGLVLLVLSSFSYRRPTPASS